LKIPIGACENDAMQGTNFSVKDLIKTTVIYDNYNLIKYKGKIVPMRN
jgi:hypothetical protein